MIVGINLGTTHSLTTLWREVASRSEPSAWVDGLPPNFVGLNDEGRVQTHICGQFDEPGQGACQ